MSRTVFDYKRPAAWILSVVFLIWGTAWTSIWTYFGLNASPIPVIAGSNGSGEILGYAPAWVNFALALIGIPLFIMGCSIALRSAQEKIVIENCNLTYIDGQGQEKIRCALSDVKSISLEVVTQRRDRGTLVVGDPRRSRSPQQWRTYHVVTTEGEFKFYESIKNGRELFEFFKSAAQKYKEAHPEEALPGTPDFY